MRKTKRFTAILLAAVLLGGCGQDNIPTESKTEELSYEHSEENTEKKDPEYIDGFEVAEYDKFNSYASENGLGGTLICIEGKVLNQTKIGDNSEFPTFGLVIEQSDGNRWCASIISDSEVEGITDKNVRIFGAYQGFSDVMNLPALAVAIEDESLIDKARIEVEENGNWVEAWNFYNDYAKPEIEKDNTEKTLSDIYNTEELKIETLGEIEYTIPKKFLENTKENGDWKYFYYEDLMIGVCCNNTTITNKALLENSDEFVDSIVSNADNGKLIESTIQNTSVAEVIRIRMERTDNGEEYVADTIAFCRNSKFYSFIFMGKKASEFDYSEDFQCLIESIEEKDDVTLYEDERVKIYFKEVGEKGVEFWVENLTDVNITIQADSVSINGISTNSIMMSDDVAPQSKGKVVAKCDDFGDVSKVETVGGQLRIIDFGGSFKTYNATFVNIEVE